MADHKRALVIAKRWDSFSWAIDDKKCMAQAYLDFSDKLKQAYEDIETFATALERAEERFANLSTQLDDIRGALVQEVSKNAALTAAADGMAEALGQLIPLAHCRYADLIAQNEKDEAEALESILDNAPAQLTAYRKLKESKYNG